MRRPPKLDEALEEVRRQIEAVVREEQMRDQLTGLANRLAMSERLQSAIEGGSPFWCAFIEIDYFKRINDKFGYDVADGLLLKVAKRLEHFDDYVPETLPIRTHGDEFYLLGTTSASNTAERIAAALESMRGEIAGVVVPTANGDMSCTVSIGWLTSDDGGEAVLTERTVVGMLEAAVGAAKTSGRNRTLRYTTEVAKQQRRSVRDDCGECRASFTVDIPSDTAAKEALFCPNCGHRHPRP